MANEAEELLDIKQAARLLQVSEVSLRRWTNSGQLRCMRIGRRRERRFRRADLLAFLEVQPLKEGGRSEPGGPRIAGVPAGHGTHICALFASKRAQLEQAVQFLATGLGGGATCFLVASAPLRRAVVAGIKEQGLDAGRLVFSEYAASPVAQLDYWKRELGKALRNDSSSFWVVGDLLHGGAGRWNSFDEILDYEDRYDRLVARRFPVVTLCQYDVRRLSGAQVLATLGRHRDNFRYPPAAVLDQPEQGSHQP